MSGEQTFHLIVSKIVSYFPRPSVHILLDTPVWPEQLTTFPQLGEQHWFTTTVQMDLGLSRTGNDWQGEPRASTLSFPKGSAWGSQTSFLAPRSEMELLPHPHSAYELFAGF